MEQRRREETDEGQWKPLRRGWVLGSEEFRAKLLEQMEGKLGEHHSGRLRYESAAAKGERIIAQELQRLKWTGSDLQAAAKTHPEKLAMAGRLRRETTLTIRQIAPRLHLGCWKSLNNQLYLAGHDGAVALGERAFGDGALYPSEPGDWPGQAPTKDLSMNG